MAGLDASFSHSSEPWAPPTLRVSRASTCDGESSQTSNHGGLTPFGGLGTCQEPSVLRVEDSTGASGSESGQSDFATIIIVDDLGFGASWQQQVRKYSFRDYSSPAADIPPQDTDECRPGILERQMSLGSETLTSVGDQFPPSPPVPPRSPQEMAHCFDKDLKGEIEKEDTSPDGITPDQLNDELWSALMISQHNSTRFVPQDQLLNAIDDLNVMSLLRHTFPHDDDGQLREKYDEICGEDHHRSRRMILATLVMINQVAYIEDFIREDIRDNHIPLAPYHDTNLCVRKNAFHKKNDRGGAPPLTSFRQWRHQELQQFFDTQYRILAPFFNIGGDVCFYKLDLSITLPFLEYSREQNGGHGSVWKVKIHPAHHNFKGGKSDPNPYFAVKAIYSEDYEQYRNEVRVLERWSGSSRGHAHLIRLLMAFQHGTRYYLLFPWATGNLVNLWQGDPLPSKSLRYIRWIMAQCLGIADGLRKIHHHQSWPTALGLGAEDLRGKNLGRHGDIKPENILCFDQNDRLVIADFGLTRFHSSDTIMATMPGRLHGVSRTYRPPEADLDAPLLQSYDVWSLGCLYLEFITWYLVGYEKTRGVNPGSFEQERIIDDKSNSYVEDKFFNLLPDPSNPADFHADVKSSVRKWIAKLRDMEECSQCISDFLDIIETQMLVGDANSRSKMQNIYHKLKKIEERCRITDNYGVNRVQAPQSRRSSLAQPAIGKLRHSMVIHDENLDNIVKMQLEAVGIIQERSPERDLGRNQVSKTGHADNEAGSQQDPGPQPPTPPPPSETRIPSAGGDKSDRRPSTMPVTPPRLVSDDTVITIDSSLMSAPQTSFSSITTPSVGPEDNQDERKSSYTDRDPTFTPNSSPSNSSRSSRSANETATNNMPLTPSKDRDSRPLSPAQGFPLERSLDYGTTLSPSMEQTSRSLNSAASNTNASCCTSESFRHGRPDEKGLRVTSEDDGLGIVNETQPIPSKSYRARFKAKWQRMLNRLFCKATGR